MSDADVASMKRYLRGGAERAGLEMPDALLEQCGVHYALLIRWNRTHNLTRIVSPEAAAHSHYLDCLVGLATCPLSVREAAGPFIDVGSGGGFPGLLAAAAWKRPGVLVEPARKRQSFLTLAAKAMGVTVTVVMPTTPAAALAGTGVSAQTVMTRATFSHGLRRELWGYLAAPTTAAAPASLVAWTTPHELPTWLQEVGTWPGARATAQSYRVDSVERTILEVQRWPMNSAGTAQEGG